MERIESGLDAFVAWQERLQRFESSGMPLDKFCREEEVCRIRLVEWLRVLRGTPERSEEDTTGFASVSAKSQSTEILLPGGGIIRPLAGIERLLLLEVIRHVSAAQVELH